MLNLNPVLASPFFPYVYYCLYWFVKVCNFPPTGHSSYKILKKIGEGGYAKVFVAESQDLDLETMVLSSEGNPKKAIKVHVVFDKPSC